jgi:hypothetical protein
MRRRAAVSPPEQTGALFARPHAGWQFGSGPLAAAVVVLTALAACHCDGNGNATEDAAADDAAIDVAGEAAHEDAAGDAVETGPDAPVCSPDAIRWPYRPTWEREEWEEWEFEPIRWDVSAYREQPVPGCERLDIGPQLGDRRWSPHRSSNYVDDTRAAMGAFATICTPMGDGRALGLYVVDTTDWTLSLVHVSGTEHDGLPSAAEGSFTFVALFDSGLAFGTMTRLPGDLISTKHLLVYDASSRQMRVVFKWNHSSGALYGSGRLILEDRGSDSDALFLYDTDRLRWTQMAVTASRGDAGLPGVWRVDFADGRAVWDMWSGSGIMSATADAPDDTVLIGYTGAPQWSPTVSGDVVCWNDGRDGAYPPGHGTDTGDPHVWCADLRTEESWCASCDIPEEEVFHKSGAAESLPVEAGGPWVAFNTINRDLRPPFVLRARLYHRGLGRSIPLEPFGPTTFVAVKYVGARYVVFFSDEHIYRCDLRVLFPEAFAPEPGGDPPPGGPPEP